MFYQKIVDYCKENNISIRKLEIKCGFSNGTIGGWKTTNPSLKSLIALAKATGIPVAEWMDEQ